MFKIYIPNKSIAPNIFGQDILKRYIITIIGGVHVKLHYLAKI